MQEARQIRQGMPSRTFGKALIDQLTYTRTFGNALIDQLTYTRTFGNALTDHRKSGVIKISIHYK